MKRTTNSVNPRRIPRSQADVDKAFERGKEEGVKGSLALTLFTLHNDFGFDEAKLKQYADAFNYTLDSLNKGYISTKDLEIVLKDEYGTTIEMR